MNEQDYKTVMAMQKYGGSFVKQLALLALHADQNNLELIKQTWSLYWGQYEKMGEEMEKEN